MATINTDIVLVGIKQGKVTSTITKDDRLILKASIVVANDIFQEIKRSGSKGKTRNSLMESLKIHRMTLGTFLRLFDKEGIIVSAPILSKSPGKPEHIYFAKEWI